MYQPFEETDSLHLHFRPEVGDLVSLKRWHLPKSLLYLKTLQYVNQSPLLLCKGQ